ncbi:MAG TPA: CPBP family intramembrane glutamic endopeptidase [Dehalococcoidia bacterium]|nr:CPBP family intramembrane glutamic endopeptidase [Dehalococcoidia bacterium]
MNHSDLTFPRLEGPPPKSERPPSLPGITWGFRDIVLGVFGALVVFFVLGAAIIGGAMAAFGEDSLETDLAEAIAIAMLDVVLVLTVLLVIARKGAGLPALGFRAPRQGWGLMLAFIVAAYFAAIGVVNIYGIAIDVLGLDQLEPAQQLPDDFYDHDVVVVLTGFAIVFMAPVAEEIFFRGFIFGGLRRYLNLPIAGLISGSLFAIAHGDPGLILPFAGVGLVLAAIYEYTRSLYASIGVHFVFNSMSFLLLLLFPDLR